VTAGIILTTLTASDDTERLVMGEIREYKGCVIVFIYIGNLWRYKGNYNWFKNNLSDVLAHEFTHLAMRSEKSASKIDSIQEHYGVREMHTHGSRSLIGNKKSDIKYFRLVKRLEALEKKKVK